MDFAQIVVPEKFDDTVPKIKSSASTCSEVSCIDSISSIANSGVQVKIQGNNNLNEVTEQEDLEDAFNELG